MNSTSLGLASHLAAIIAPRFSALSKSVSVCHVLLSGGTELARQHGRKAAAMMDAAGAPFRVIVRVVSEPTLRRRRSRRLL